MKKEKGKEFFKMGICAGWRKNCKAFLATNIKAHTLPTFTKDH